MTLSFTLLLLSRASDNTTSQNIGGTDAWAVPTSNFCGTVPPVPLGTRPWTIYTLIVDSGRSREAANSHRRGRER